MSLWDRLTGNDQRKRLEEERRQLEVARQMSLRRAQQSSNPQVAQQATQKLNNGGWRLNAEPIETTAQAIGKSVYNAPKQVFNGAVNFVKPYAKSINLAGNMVTKGATVPFAAYDITKESLFGTDQSYQQKLNNYGNYLRTGGLGKTGGLLNAGTGITNLNEFKDPKKLVGSILETGTNLGSFVPTGKAWQASVSGTKAIKPLLTYGGGNAVVNMAGSAGTQLIETGKVDPKGLIAPAVAGIALPVAGYGLGRGAKPAFKPTQKPVNNPRAPKTTNTFDPKAEKEQYALRLRQYGSETKDPAERFRIGQELQRVSKAIADYDKKQGQGGFVRNPLVNDDGTSRLGKVDPLEALKAEARKYKSAEEFIKAQGEPLYHGSPNTEKITALKAHDGVEGYFGNGVYLTRNPEVASRFTKLDSASPNLEAIGNGNFMDINTGRVVKGGKPGVISATLPKDIKLKNITEPEMTAEIEKFRQPNGVIDLKAARNAVRDKYAKQGYDGFEVTATKYFDEPQTVIFPQSESKIKTKQQLTDIYNQNLNDQFNSYLNQATTSQNINPRTAMEFLNTYNNVLSSRIEKANLGRLSDNTSQMAKNAGIRITKNPEVVLETRYMKHLESEHRTGKPDKSFITDEDLARLPDVIFNPDRITNGGIKRGAQRALFEKSFDEYHTVVAEVIQRGDQISVVTYKKDPLNKVSQLSVTDRLDASMPQGNVSGKPPQGFSPNNTIPNKTNPVNPIRGFEKLKKLDKKQGQGGFVRNPLVNDDGTSRIGNPFAPKMVTPDGAVIPTRAKTPNVRSESVVPYKGREAVNIDEYITDTAPRGVDDRSFIRNAILGKFKNKRITLSNGNEATVGRNEAGKLSGKSYKEQLPEHLDTKLNSSMYIDELGVTVRNLRPDTNRKNFKSNAPSIEKGDITIISRGVPHEAELVIRKYPDGTYRIYDVIVPKENTPSRVGVSAEHRVIRGDSGDTIPTNTTNVNGLSTAPPVGKTAPQFGDTKAIKQVKTDAKATTASKGITNNNQEQLVAPQAKSIVDFAPVQKVQTAPNPLELQIVTTPRIGGVKPTNAPLDLLAKFNRFNLSLLLLSVGIV